MQTEGMESIGFAYECKQTDCSTAACFGIQLISRQTIPKVMQTIPHYDQNAEQLVSQYESLTFEHVHPALLDLLPPPGATILDVGAGSGRDAAWFAAKGYDVVAAEP